MKTYTIILTFLSLYENFANCLPQLEQMINLSKTFDDLQYLPIYKK